MSFIDYLSTLLSKMPSLERFFGSDFLTNFHFIRPWWLLAFFALGLTLYIIKRIRYYQSPWKHFLPPHLSTVLLERSDNKVKETSSQSHVITLIKPFIIGCCLIVALAGPAWNKIPQPVFQLARGSVLIMDMSYSMYSTDIMPNRLTRARYKAIDLLENINEGDIGLIAYSGDAFIISPLTEDIRNIELLLPSLSPDIMPVLGADALIALNLANETLNNAGHLEGDIYWFTDDVDNEEINDIYAWSAEYGHKLHILGVGTQAGAPIKLKTGELLKDNSGAIVVPKLPSGKLAALAQRGGGNYSTITNDDSDIKRLTQHLNTEFNDSSSDKHADKKAQENRQGDQYQEQGPWLLLIVIPLFLTYFRRGSAILSVGLFLPLSWLISLSALTLPSTSYAEEIVPVETNQQVIAEPSKSSFWKDLWQTKDQQAQQNFEQEKYKEAATQFNNKQWQGSAHYKAGNYQKALNAFKQGDSSNALYNQGNSHAQMQQYDKAIDAYKKALAKDPSFTDAQDNIDKIEELKKQQEQQNQSQDGEESQESDDESQENSQDQKSQDQSQEQSKESDSEQQDGQQSDEQNGQQQDESQSQEEKEQEAKEQSEQSEQQNEETEAEKQKQQAAKEGEEQDGEGEKTPAQIARDKKAQEDMQKHQQLLNKVTDDPYLLLRNKMRLEYQKRQHESNRQGENKKW